VGCATQSQPTKPPFCNDPDNARIRGKCNNIPCGPENSSVCGYNVQCFTSNETCSVDNSQCERRDVSLDCRYNSPGCRECGIGHVADIYCDFDGNPSNGKENHCGYICVPNSLCNASSPSWCDPTPTSDDGGGGTNPTNTPTPTHTPTPTNTPTPTRTPTPTPTPDPHWVKLKNTSFYTSKQINQPIPFPPLAYDEDDDGSRYFIIASSGSDPGLVATSYISLGTGSVSTKNWKTTEPQNPFTFTPSQFLAYLKARTALKTITDINDISSINSDTVAFNGNLGARP
jgi:hypothetical protein